MGKEIAQTHYEVDQVDFWINAWEEASRVQRRSSGQQALGQQVTAASGRGERAVARWNHRAESYARNSSGTTYQDMQRTVLDFLEFSGVEVAGANILDLGCGPGNYTLPLARKAAHVWALDPAEGMLQIVMNRTTSEGLANISCVQQTWQEFNIQQENWVGKFDLVFASMTPGISDKETLDKMISASKGYCYLSSFSGRRRNSLQERLWPLLTEEPDPWSNRGMDIVYPLNLLYALGYFPSLKFINSKWSHVEDIDKTTQKLLDWLDGFLDVSEETTCRVRDFVAAEAVDGLVTEEGQANMGLMVWKV